MNIDVSVTTFVFITRAMFTFRLRCFFYVTNAFIFVSIASKIIQWIFFCKVPLLRSFCCVNKKYMYSNLLYFSTTVMEK